MTDKIDKTYEILGEYRDIQKTIDLMWNNYQDANINNDTCQSFEHTAMLLQRELIRKLCITFNISL